MPSVAAIQTTARYPSVNDSATALPDPDVVRLHGRQFWPLHVDLLANRGWQAQGVELAVKAVIKHIRQNQPHRRHRQ